MTARGESADQGEIEDRFPGPAPGVNPLGALTRATRNSVDGFAHAIRTERAFRHEAFALALAVPLACVLTGDLAHRAVLIGALMFVMAVELLNTCAEKICDLVMPQRHPAVKAIKDMGSAAVLLSLTACGLAWGAEAAHRFV